MKAGRIELDRKVLADLAVHDEIAFASLVAKSQGRIKSQSGREKRLVEPVGFALHVPKVPLAFCFPSRFIWDGLVMGPSFSFLTMQDQTLRFVEQGPR